jgi:hypothetical protein
MSINRRETVAQPIDKVLNPSLSRSEDLFSAAELQAGAHMHHHRHAEEINHSSQPLIELGSTPFFAKEPINRTGLGPSSHPPNEIIDRTGLPSPADVFGISDSERMKSVDRNTAEVNRLFPDDHSGDFNSPKSAAYRYLMNKECVDDYSSSSANDAAILEKASPGILKKLDEIVREHLKSGPAPGSHCDAPTS